MNRRNPFGGANPHGMYFPMSEDELEVLDRLAKAGEFKIVIKDWGHVSNFLPGRYNPETYQGQPIVCFGDKRITFVFRMHFTAPEVPQPCWYFDLEVWALGIRFFPGAPSPEDPYPGRYPTTSNGQPCEIVAGLHFDLALDVSIDQIDPQVVKMIKPKTLGLTTRVDNTRLDLHRQSLLAGVLSGNRAARRMTALEAVKATNQKKTWTG